MFPLTHIYSYVRWIIVTGEQEAQAAVHLEAAEKQLGPQDTRILSGQEARMLCAETFR